ncbi:MAG: helix-turn-helix transcriptional regulator [Bacteroidales bacterium]
MKDRIQQFLRSENKSSSKFAEEIGVQPSGVSHVLSGRNKPSLDFILKMLNTYPSVNTDWLLFGKGEMYKSDETRLQLDKKDPGTSPLTGESYSDGNLFKGFDREFDNKGNRAGTEKAETDEYPASDAESDTGIGRTGTAIGRSGADPGNVNESAGESPGDHDLDFSDRIIIFYTDGTYREYKPRR